MSRPLYAHIGGDVFSQIGTARPKPVSRAFAEHMLRHHMAGASKAGFEIERGFHRVACADLAAAVVAADRWSRCTGSQALDALVAAQRGA